MEGFEILMQCSFNRGECPNTATGGSKVGSITYMVCEEHKDYKGGTPDGMGTDQEV